jgi:hypothetical protein
VGGGKNRPVLPLVHVPVRRNGHHQDIPETASLPDGLPAAEKS